MIGPCRRESERGQTLPLATFGVIALLAFTFFALTYGNQLRWQIRAQSAADSTAQAILSQQTQEFNQMTAVLYAAAVEEYRIRRTLNAMLLAVNQQGGCATLVRCNEVYQAIRPVYLKAVARYTTDIGILHRVTASLNLANVVRDGNTLARQLQTDCAGPTGGDCQFSYVLLAVEPRTDLESVAMDARAIRKPSYQNRTGPANVNLDLLAPVRVEVAVCATVPPIFAGFFNYQPKPFRAIARAAAAAVMVEEDWMQPGVLQNPGTGNVFQPPESFVAPAILDAQSYDWYDLNYGGNASKAYTSFNVFSAGLFLDEFSAELGWWNSIPIHPFSGVKTTKELGCAS